MIDDFFAERVFSRLDKSDKKIDNLCERMVTQETKYDLHIANSVQKKQDKKDKKVWYMGLLTFVVGTYIAVKELM